MSKNFAAHSVLQVLFAALTFPGRNWFGCQIDMSSGPEDVLVTIKSSFHSDQRGIQTFRVSDFFVKQSVLATNSSWLPGQGQIPMRLGQQAQRVNTLLKERETNAVQITLWSIQIAPTLSFTNQSLAAFRFNSRLKSDVQTKQILVVLLLDGTIAVERPHPNSMTDSRSDLGSSGLANARPVDQEEVKSAPITGVDHGSPNAQHESEFEIPQIQWAVMAGDDYPVDLCAQEALAASYLKRQMADVQALKLEGIVLEHYLPMRAIIAKGLEVPAHLNHWHATFWFRDTATDSGYHVPVLLDNRILGFTEFSRKNER